MKLNAELIAKLARKYTPSSVLNLSFRGKDLVLTTDEEGNGAVLFVGKLQADGRIKGERYTRVLVRDRAGFVIKDHWDRKGYS